MTELKLYKVQITYEAMVIAEDEDDAYFVARDNVRSIIEEEYSIEVLEHIDSEDKLHSDWIGALPYGDNPDELTCNQILEAKNEDKKKEMIESLSDEQKYQLLSTLTIADIVNLIQKDK